MPIILPSYRALNLTIVFSPKSFPPIDVAPVLELTYVEIEIFNHDIEELVRADTNIGAIGGQRSVKPIIDQNPVSGHSIVKEATSDELVEISEPMIGGVVEPKDPLQTFSKEATGLFVARFASPILLYTLNLCQRYLKNYKTRIMMVLEVFAVTEEPTSDPIFIDQDLSVDRVFGVFLFASEVYHHTRLTAVSFEIEAYSYLTYNLFLLHPETSSAPIRRTIE